MPVSLKHLFNSAKADGVDSTLVQPSNWNSEHVLTAAASKVLGRDSSGAGAVQELPLAFDASGQSMVPPTGTTAQRPGTPVAGMVRYNTTLSLLEAYIGGVWAPIGDVLQSQLQALVGPYRGFTFGTPQVLNGLAAVDWFSIPSWATELIVQIFNVSLNNNDHLLVQLGSSGGFTTSGYVCESGTIDTTAVGTVSSSAGFIVYQGLAADICLGEMRISLIALTGWVSSHAVRRSPNKTAMGGGGVSIPGYLDRIRFTKSGSGIFDGGTVNVGWR